MTREFPHSPVALHEVAHLFGVLVAETILASVHVRAHKQAGHMNASDLIKALQNILQRRGRPHMGNVGSSRSWRSLDRPVSLLGKHYMKVATIVGARPQFIKAAVVSRHLRKQAEIRETLVHAGQHCDASMSPIFFRELAFPAPDCNPGVVSRHHGGQK